MQGSPNTIVSRTIATTMVETTVATITIPRSTQIVEKDEAMV